MRLIDGDELYQKVVGYNGGAVDKTVAKRLIDQMPTVDAVSRQAVIDLCDWYDNPSMHDDLEKLPSAQPEIIRCEDCKYKKVYCFPPKYYERDYCVKHEKTVDVADFCSWAERRTDGEQSD